MTSMDMSWNKFRIFQVCPKSGVKMALRRVKCHWLWLDLDHSNGIKCDNKGFFEEGMTPYVLQTDMIRHPLHIMCNPQMYVL